MIPRGKGVARLFVAALLAWAPACDDEGETSDALAPSRSRGRASVQQASADDAVDDSSDLHDLSGRVGAALKDVFELTAKLQNRDVEVPDDIPDLPRELSFWIGAHLDNRAAAEQQALLELTDTRQRLERQFEMLDHTRRQLAARTVLMDLKEQDV